MTDILARIEAHDISVASTDETAALLQDANTEICRLRNTIGVLRQQQVSSSFAALGPGKYHAV
jgi:hypothetical protein